MIHQSDGDRPKTPAGLVLPDLDGRRAGARLKSAELSSDDRRRIGEDIKTVEFGWPVGMPVCKPLSNGLWEVRTNLKDRIARILFCVHDGRMVLLHGFIKKSQRTPKADISTALERKRRMERA
jgi:phage-related protein